MQSNEELNLKALGIILDFKPNGNIDKPQIDEMYRLKNDVKKAISVLEKDEKEVLELNLLQKLSALDIANKLGKSEEKVKNDISNAAIKVKKIISEKANQIPDENALEEIARKNPIVMFIAFLINIGFLVAIVFCSYFLLQKFVFNNMPTISHFFNQTAYVIKQHTSNNQTFQNIVENTKYLSDTDPSRLRISGSTSLLSLSRRWENAFSIDFPKYTVQILSSDSEDGIDKLLKGKIDIANSSRPLTFHDRNLARQNGIELAEYRIAIDALVVVVNKNNNIDSIGLDDLEKIYSGKITNWKDINGFDKPVFLITREEGSGTNEVVKNRILGGETITMSINTIKSNNEILALVSNHEGAISCINSNNFDWGNKNIKYIKVKSYKESLAVSPFIGQKLNEDVISYGDYPLAHYLYLVTYQNPPQKTADFVNWVLSEEGQKVVKYSGLVPVSYN